MGENLMGKKHCLISYIELSVRRKPRFNCSTEFFMLLQDLLVVQGHSLKKFLHVLEKSKI